LFRYIVERISDGALLDLEFPADVDAASKMLSAPGAFSCTVKPENLGSVRNEDGTLIVDPNATYIHEESDGLITGTWLVRRSAMVGSAWSIEADGFSGFFSGRPFEGVYRGVEVDPIDAARTIASRSQAIAGADAGINLTGSSNRKVGTDSDEKAAEAKTAMKAAKDAWDVKAKPRKALQEKIKRLGAPYDRAINTLKRQRNALVDTYEEKTKQKRPSAEIAAAKAAVDAKSAEISEKQSERADLLRPLKDDCDELRLDEAPLKKAYDAAREKWQDAKQQAQEDGGAWKVLAWDTPDCLDEIQRAIDAGHQEWVEHSYWNKSKTAIVKEIRCQSTIGKKQRGLRFVEGENVIEQVTVEDDSADYANAIIAIGAGEGRDALRTTVAKSDRRLRTLYVLDAKDVTKKDVLKRKAKAELKRRMVRQRVAGIRVRNSDLAQFGTFAVGDTIPISIARGWVGRKTLWRRIVELERIDEWTVDIMLGEPK